MYIQAMIPIKCAHKLCLISRKYQQQISKYNRLVQYNALMR